MKRFVTVLIVGAVMAAWCPPAFAARQTVVGPVPTPLSPDGVTGGVDMTAQGAGGTLNVGTVGGPQTDIFTDNSSGGNVVDPLAFALTSDVASMSDVTFFSSSNVFGTIGTAAIFLNLTEAGTAATVNLFGNVTSTTFNVGTGTVNFNSGAINTTALNYTGDGTISLGVNTTVIGALTTTAGAQTGTLVLNNGSVLDGAVGGAVGLRTINVVGGNNTAGVSATITGAVDVYSLSLLTNTLNIGGTLTLHDGSVIDTILADPMVYGHAVPTGDANIGATLTVGVTVPTTAYIPPGTLFNIVDAVSGTDGSVVTVISANPLYTFTAANTTNGLVQLETTTIPLQASPNPVVPVLIATPATPDLISVLAPINALTTPTAVISAVSQLTPSTPSFAAPLVTFQGTRQFQKLWLSRFDMCSQAVCRDKETEGCPYHNPNAGWWLKGFGYFGEQDARGVSTGYDARILGMMLAFDMPIGQNTRAGAGFGYARSTIDGHTFDADADIDTYQATAFIAHERGPWFVNGSASFGWNEYSSTRHIVFPGVDRTANADFSGQTYTAYAGTGFHLPLGQFTITPIASLQYTHMKIDAYTESGAGNINLDVESQRYDYLESALGVKVERPFSTNLGRLSLVPEAHFNWYHALANPDVEQDAKFTAPGSSSFTTQGRQMADDTFNIGAGISLLWCKGLATTWSLEAVYDHDWTTDGYTANQVKVRLTCGF